MAERMQLVVSIDEGHLNNLKKIEKALIKAGFKVTEVMSAVGVVTGTISSDKYNQLLSIEGVHISESQNYQLPPPDSELQ
jgi:methylmalonyl-CoA mutase cobalamin-binding subunit